MTEAIVSIVVQTLGDLLAEEFNVLSGVTDQVQEVSRELKRMQCFLRDADTRDYKDETIRNWLREIRRLTYRIEDIVETFAVEVASKREKGVKKALKRLACIFCEGRSLHKLGLEISRVENDISNLTLSLERYDIKGKSEGGTSGGSTEENDKWTRQTYAHEVEEYFVGMEDDMRKLVSLVVDEKKHLPIISLWGMGGLGKTTIARKIYHHRDVRRRFQLFAWVCITQQGQTRGILQDILMQFSPTKEKEAIKSMEDRELVEQLSRVQTENKCLVVLDDIWYLRDWQKLVHAFPIVQGTRSNILLTTRMKEVAEVGIPYELRCLNDEESWKLLKDIVFSRKNVQDMKIESKLEAVGLEMAHKCGGLPLAICVLGGILKDMDSLKDWQIVNKNIDSYLSTGKDCEEGSGEEGAVARVLSLSYTVLPYHLKPCFLYLGSFQEDEKIDTEQLYLLWIAEGMVLSQHQRRGETLMEVAERYLNELGKRSMVQVHVDEFLVYRRFDSCRLHDMMRDYCIKKGREEEFLKVIDLQGQGVQKSLLHSFSPINNAAYRLVIHADSNPEAPIKANSALEDYKQIRSLLVHNTHVIPFVESKITGFKWIKFICENFRLLRVLKFERYNFGGKKMPKGVEKLIHLRLLSFSGCILDRIPSSIAKLPFLETLDLRGIDHMPNVLRKMKRLRHLYLGYSYELEKVRLSGLSELETLDGFQSKSHEVTDLHELANLRSLKAVVTENKSIFVVINYISNNAPNLRDTELIFKSSVSFSSEEGSFLLTKILECGNIHHLKIYAEISKFPRYEEHFLLGLVELELRKTQIDEDPIETLEKLPQLRYLVLGAESYLGTDLICHESGFPQLLHLSLSILPNLHSWRVESGGMPNLSSLTIHDCSELEMIPEGLKDVTGLKELVIQYMPPTFVDRVRVRDDREGEDFYKIQHVPSITIIKYPGI